MVWQRGVGGVPKGCGVYVYNSKGSWDGMLGGGKCLCGEGVSRRWGKVMRGVAKGCLGGDGVCG